MATWSEVRELAAKLKTTQERTSVQNLSERTWVDIIRHLINSNRIKLIFTSDGRSYMTKEELEKEIREELEAHDGRITLAELASCLDVDQPIIESRVSDMISSDALAKVPDRMLGIPGEVINDSYLRQVAHDIRDRLEEKGHTTLGQLATIFSLPTSILLGLLQEYQGVLFRLHKFGDEYITDAHLSLNKAKVRGYFIPLLHPVTLSSAASRLKMPEALLVSVVSSLINDDQLCGNLAAGRNTYIPWCYTAAENDYIQAFYTQNGYIEWDHLKRIGIVGPTQQQRSLLVNAIHLSTVSVGPTLLNQLNATIEEAAKEDSWVDLTHCFPPSVGPNDRLGLINKSLEKFSMKAIDDGLYLVSTGFLLKCLTYFDKFLRDRAEEAIRERSISSSTKQREKSEEETSTKRTQHIKGGFGMGAREIKTKNVKKKYIAGKRKNYSEAENSAEASGDVDNVESVFVKFISIEEIIDILTNELPSDVPHTVISGIADLIQPQLAREFSKLLNSIFLPNSNAARSREMITQTQDMVNNMLFSIQLIHRGIDAVDRVELRKQLLCHLVKNQGTCVIDALCTHLANYYGVSWPTDASDSTDDSMPNSPGTAHFSSPLASNQRTQLVDLLVKSGSSEAAEAALALNKTIEMLRNYQATNADLTEYYTKLESLATEQLGLTLTTLHAKAGNKRKKDERQKANELALQTEMQLDEAVTRVQNTGDIKDAATATLAATCLFSQVAVGWPVTAPGKLVPELVDWLTEMKNREEPAATNQAFDKFVKSEAINHLKLLTNKISQDMHLGPTLTIDTSMNAVFTELVQIAKSCRKLLYT